MKLCDFGISRLIQEKVDICEIMGTVDYMRKAVVCCTGQLKSHIGLIAAPEILRYEPISLASDIWSIGIVAYVLLSGHSPFGGNDKVETYSNITSAPLEFPDRIFRDVSEQAKDFIRRCLVRKPK